MSVHILKTAQASSLSSRSTLTYQIGATSPEHLFIRIHGNSGGGLYCKDWFDLSAIESCFSATAANYPSDSRSPDSQDSAGGIGAAKSEVVEVVEVGADHQNFPGVGPADLRAVIGRRSINTLGFVMAALNHLGLVRPSKHKPGKFIPQSTDVFRLEMAGLFQAVPAEASMPEATDTSMADEESKVIARQKRKNSTAGVEVRL